MVQLGLLAQNRAAVFGLKSGKNCGQAYYSACGNSEHRNAVISKFVEKMNGRFCTSRKQSNMDTVYRT